MDGYWKRPTGLSTINIVSGLVLVFSCAVVASYAAGSSFRPTLAPLAPPVSPIVIPVSAPVLPAEGDFVAPVRPRQGAAVVGQTRRFRVEAGAYPTAAPAEEMAGDLRRRGFAAQTVPGPVFRVRVGGSLDRQTADTLLGVLRAAGFDATLTGP